MHIIYSLSIKKNLFFCLVGVLLFFSSSAQQLVKLTLAKTIAAAQENSLEFRIASNKSKASYWNYENYKARFLPKLSINGLLPEYNRTINLITLPSGENGFVKQNVANTSVNLSLSQGIKYTGGNLSVGSSLRRLENFGTFRNTGYTSVPFTVNYNQGNIFYNDFKWQEKIEPLKLKESEREFLETLEEISGNAVEHFFNMLIAKRQLSLDEQNMNNIDTLLKITKSKFGIGTLQLNDVLQAEISSLNAKKSVANSKLNLHSTKQELIKFLNLEKGVELDLEIPDSVSFFLVNPAIALEKAYENRKVIIEFKRRKVEAEQVLAKTKAETGPSISINANLGLTQTDPNFNYVYNNLLRNQAVSIGFSIPLIDWGVNRSNRKRAEANLELTKNYISQETLSFEQEVLYQVMKWRMHEEQLKLAREMSDLAQRRYLLAKQKYINSGINYTEFNNAQLDKDRAVLDYVDNIKKYWQLFYQIRRMTLFDFRGEKPIVFENKRK